MPLGFIIYPYLFYLVNHKNFVNRNKMFQFTSGFLYGLGMMSIILIWIKEPFYIDPKTQNFSFFSYLLIVYCSLYFGITFLIINYFKKSILKLIILPLVLVISEIICSNLGYGFPWSTYSLIHSGNLFGVSLIYYFGNYGLSYLTLLLFLVPSLILIYRNVEIKIIYKLYIFFIFIIILISFFLFYIRSFDIKTVYSRDVDISLAQLNFPLDIPLQDSIAKHRELSILNEIIKNKSELIIFAENNYPYLIDQTINISSMLKNLNIDNSVIIGLTRNEKNNLYNSLSLIDQNNSKFFDKKILVPFGEFVPFRKFFNFLDIIAGSKDFKQGNKDRIIKTKNNLNIIPVICYEIIFFGKLINNINHHGDLIVNITNDAWFGKFSGPYQHFYLARLRASEYNKPLVRVSNNGVSALIDNFGNIVGYIPLNKSAVKTFNISLLKHHKNYLGLHKNIFYFIFLFFLVGIILNFKYESRVI